MSTVYLGRCDRYEDVLDALSPIWEKLHAADMVARKKVLLKVNLTKGGPPESAVATHPAFAAALVKLVRDSGGEPYVGDSCSIYGFTRETMDLAGYCEMARKLNVPCIPLDSGKIRAVNVNGVRVKETYMSQHVLDADVIVSVPKLKPHDFVEFSCAVKNLYGTLPGAIKPYHHFKKPAFEDFLNVILDVFEVVKPAMAFVDGILAMEGQGPTNGDPKHVGVVAASTDLVALDTVLADLVGLPPVKLLSAAGKRGLGVSDLDQIEIVGPPRDGLRVRIRPATPSKAKIGILGKIKYGVRYHGVRPALNTDRKDLLQNVADLCPVEAIDLSGKPRIRRNCVKCMTCIESCEDNAVTLKVPKILHRTYRSKAPGYDLSKMK
jgi:uncharacterized protein (DUF362 family)/NAD-dependent dihydropyrimidine dehydrogenase PreA subunit